MATAEQMQSVITEMSGTIQQQAATIESMKAEMQKLWSEIAGAAAAAASAATATMAGKGDKGGDSTFRRVDVGKALEPYAFHGDGDQRGKFRTWAWKLGIYMSQCDVDSCVQEQMDWAAKFQRDIESSEYKN